MITLFTIPKPFVGHIGVIQRNAIRSWKRIHPLIEILIFGDEKGIREFARDEGLRHFPVIEVNDQGTPLLNKVFETAVTEASSGVLAFVNADIILFKDFVTITDKIKDPDFLIVGPRCDIKLEHELQFEIGWQREIFDLVGAARAQTDFAKLRIGSDFFIFPRSSKLTKLPPFAVGRPGWDNWMFYNCLRKKIPLYDACTAITSVHQDHDYAHVKVTSARGRWEGPEGDLNKVLYLRDMMASACSARNAYPDVVDGLERMKHLEDEEYSKVLYDLFCPYRCDRRLANFRLENGGRVIKMTVFEKLFRYCDTAHIFSPEKKFRNGVLFRIRNVIKKLGNNFNK